VDVHKKSGGGFALFARIIQNAFESGGEVIVILRGQDESFRGQVRDFDGIHFTVFHRGRSNGFLWAFRLEDVLSCALLIPEPNSAILEVEVDPKLQGDVR
jgi:hypothetical protein